MSATKMNVNQINLYGLVPSMDTVVRERDLCEINIPTHHESTSQLKRRSVDLVEELQNDPPIPLGNCHKLSNFVTQLIQIVML